MTLSDSSVADYLKANFVRVHLEKGQDPEGEKLLNVRRIPATIIFGSDGTEQARKVGYADPEPFLAWLRETVGE